MFDNNTKYAKCILVDSEPKVTECFYDKKYINKSNIIFDQPGMAGNWALGYSERNVKHLK